MSVVFKFHRIFTMDTGATSHDPKASDLVGRQNRGSRNEYETTGKENRNPGNRWL
jgi:hypothetical protein